MIILSTWKISRGVTTNRVRRGNLGGRSRTKGGRELDASPRRAKRQRSQGAGELWTQICISVRVDDLCEIDERAERAGLSRSAYLVSKAKT